VILLPHADAIIADLVLEYKLFHQYVVALLQSWQLSLTNAGVALRGFDLSPLG